MTAAEQVESRSTVWLPLACVTSIVWAVLGSSVLAREKAVLMTLRHAGEAHDLEVVMNLPMVACR